MTDNPTGEQVAARLDFVAQENVLHEQLSAITTELVAARQRGPGAKQWQAGLAHLVALCDAVDVFRAQWQELVRPDA